jgi:hypothetical protein
MPTPRRLDLRVDLDDVSLRIAEEQRPVPPARKILRGAHDRDALGKQLGMARVGRRRRDGNAS